MDICPFRGNDSEYQDYMDMSGCIPMQEDLLGTKDEIGNSNVHLDSSNPHLDLVPQELILVTAPKIARGVPLPIYMNLDLYSGFWCTSRCVVF